MAEKTIPTKEQLINTPKRKIAFECLKRGQTQKEAAKQANLTYGYTRYWITKNNIMDLVMRETAVKTEDLREKRLRQLNTRLDNPDLTDATFAKLLDLQGKLCGWHTQTINLESPSRQRELDEHQKQLADEMAIARRKYLTGSDVTVYDTQDREPEPDKIDTNCIESNSIDSQ